MLPLPRDLPVVAQGDRDSDFVVLQALLRNEPVVVGMQDVGSQWRGWQEWREPTTGAFQVGHFLQCFGALPVSIVSYGGTGTDAPKKRCSGSITSAPSRAARTDATYG